MKQETKYDRRRFLGSAAMSIAAAKFVAISTSASWVTLVFGSGLSMTAKPTGAMNERGEHQ